MRTEVRGHHKRVTALAFTPGGQLLCGGIDTTVLGYDVRLRPGGGDRDPRSRLE